MKHAYLFLILSLIILIPAVVYAQPYPWLKENSYFIYKVEYGYKKIAFLNITIINIHNNIAKVILALQGLKMSRTAREHDLQRSSF